MAEGVQVQEASKGGPGRVLEVFLAALRLGLTSFGGPIAHLGYFREEYVARRRWLDEQTYADVVALCQVLPGPASSQVGITVGIMRAGLLGGVAAWVGFTMPSALALIAFAYGVTAFDVADAGWVHGLKVAAVAVVAQAVWGMARTLTPDKPRITLAIAATVATLALASAWGQVLIITASGVIGWRFLRSAQGTAGGGVPVPVGRGLAIASLVLMTLLLVGLPVGRQFVEHQGLALFDSFFRVGSLVFGGGHVVLPLLEREVVPPGWVTGEQFLAGYGAAQAVPGPLFTFSAYLGAVMGPQPNGWLGGMLALVAVFLPSFLLVTGCLPFWNALRTRPWFQPALRGVNAGVVGLLLAALYQPVWTSAITSPAYFSLGLACFGLLAFWRLPPWVVVALAAAGGAGIGALGW
ncbi:MAG: chromate efflux transporter [Chloroflexi bacterium]|nr:chromate efflux transporter [Chloroflexota bacterium]